MKDSDDVAALADALGIAQTWHILRTYDCSYIVTAECAQHVRDVLSLDKHEAPLFIDVALVCGAVIPVRTRAITTTYENTPALRREDYARELLVEREQKQFNNAHKNFSEEGES
jgi:hypothetical protein